VNDNNNRESWWMSATGEALCQLFGWLVSALLEFLSGL
jgi:hypothetical protein